MNVSHLLSSVLHDLAADVRNHPHSAGEELHNRNRSREFLNRLMQEEMRQKDPSSSPTPRKPDHPVSPKRPTSPGRPAQIRQIYTARGEISQMSSFPTGKKLDTARIAKQSETFFPNTNNALPAGPTVNEKVIASLIQQNFQLIRESLDREKEQKRRKRRFKISVSYAAEEKALELLEILLEHADEAEDMAAYCRWARGRIDHAEAQIHKHRNTVPEQTRQSFGILRDAILALENGLSPDFIFTRLKDEIRRKKKLLENPDVGEDSH